MAQEKLVEHAPLPLMTWGSQIGLHTLEMHRSPATQLSAPLLTPIIASSHCPPSAIGAAPTATQPLWPISSAVIVALASTTHVHFSPVLQPVWAIGSQSFGASAPESRSVTLPPPPPHAAVKPTNRAPSARFFIAQTPLTNESNVRQSSLVFAAT